MIGMTWLGLALLWRHDSELFVNASASYSWLVHDRQHLFGSVLSFMIALVAEQ